LHEQIKIHNVLHKIETLTKAIDNGYWQETHTTAYQTLDDIVTESMLMAERSVSKSFSKKFDWSPKLKQAVQAHRYWKLRLQQKRGGLVSNSRVAHHREAANIPDDSPMTESQIIEAIKGPAKQLKDLQRRHRELRTTYLEELTESIVLSQAPSLAFDSMAAVRNERRQIQVRRLIQREANRRTYRKIRGIIHPRQITGLSRVDIPDQKAASQSTGDPADPKTWTGPWISIMTPTELAGVVKGINRKQYHQAHTTPFGSGELAQQM
jgi:hypothetical protein